MSRTNENILKSLAALEQDLKEINSAKDQVNSVVNSSDNLASAIKSYQKSFESLSTNINAVIEASRKLNNNTSSKLTVQLNKLSNEISKLESVDLEDQSKKIQNILTNHAKKQQEELDNKTVEIKNQCDTINSRLAKQEKEINIIRNMLLVISGIIIIGIFLTY